MGSGGGKKGLDSGCYKGKPTEFSGKMDVRSKKKKGVKDVSQMFSLHIRKNGIASFTIGKEQIWGDRFTLRSL